MDTLFTFRDFEATEGLKDHALKKFEKINKYLIKPGSSHVILSKDGFQHKAEITVVDSGVTYVAAEKTNDMYLSIDKAITRLLTQLKKHKERIKERHKSNRA